MKPDFNKVFQRGGVEERDENRKSLYIASRKYKTNFSLETTLPKKYG